MEKDLYLLFISMLRLIKVDQLHLVALLQNIIRKIVLNNGKLEVQYQKIIHRFVIQNKK